jgi:hypothetical protein
LCGIPEVLFESNATGAYQLLDEKTPAQALIYNQHKKAGQLVTQVVFSARVIDVLGFTSHPISFNTSLITPVSTYFDGFARAFLSISLALAPLPCL